MFKVLLLYHTYCWRLAIAQKGKGRDKSRPYKSHMYLSTRECHAQVMALPADSSQVHPSCRAVDAGAPGDTVGIVQADIEWRGDDGIESFAKHAVAVGADHIVADAHTLRAVDALVGIAQDEAVRHVKFIVVIIARLAIVEAVIGQS